MAQGWLSTRGWLSSEALSCAVCLELLKRPVTLPCGHSFCLGCVDSCWAGAERDVCCPQCRHRFERRPALAKNTVMTALVEELGRRTSRPQLPPAAADAVCCDVCSDQEEPAVKSCLQCLASYCPLHLRPHHDAAAFRTHKLIQPRADLRESACPKHRELTEVFCRTDQRCVCYLCSVDQHKGHDLVPAAEEREERQRQCELELHRGIRGREQHLEAVDREIRAFSDSAEAALKEVEEIFAETAALVGRRSGEVRSRVQETQRAAVAQLKHTRAALERERDDLREKQAEVNALSQSPDHAHFLRHCPPAADSDPKPWFAPPQSYFSDVLACTTTAQREMTDALNEGCEKVSSTLGDVGAFLRRPPSTVGELVKHFCAIKLEANIHVPTSEEGRRAELTAAISKILDWGLRDYGGAVNRLKVFSAEALSGRCYWEMACSSGTFCVALAYRDLSAEEQAGLFGDNSCSWALYHRDSAFSFRHAAVETPLPGPPCSRVGLYLDSAAGMLCFYDVTESLRLLHEARAVFSRPLHLGIHMFSTGTMDIFTTTTLSNDDER